MRPFWKQSATKAGGIGRDQVTHSPTLTEWCIAILIQWIKIMKELQQTCCSIYQGAHPNKKLKQKKDPSTEEPFINYILICIARSYRQGMPCLYRDL